MARVRVFKSYLKTPFLILLSVEICIVVFTVYSAILLRFFDSPSVVLQFSDLTWLIALILAVITAISMFATGLYHGNIREGMAGILLRLFVSLAASGILVSLVFYLIPQLYLGRGTLAIAQIQSFFIIGTLRAIFFELVDTETFKKNILVYGAGDTAAHIESKLRRKSDRRAFNIVGYVLLENQQQVKRIEDTKLLIFSDSLLDYSIKNNIDEIVVATSDVKARIPVNDILECKLHGIEVVDIISFFEREVGQVRVDLLDPRWLIFSEGFFQSRPKDFIKRAFDISSSLVLLTITTPFMFLATIAIKLEDGVKSRVFYFQERVGLNGNSFRVYKLRSMRSDAETPGKAVWASKVDSRVTRVGSFIRKTRIDEIPQIYNVLTGDMSMVGPRPERPEFVDELGKEIPYYHDRHLIKPGVTGWAQLKYPYGSSVKDSYQKQLFDMYYVKNHSLFLDFLILIQTVEVVLFGKGAR